MTTPGKRKTTVSATKRRKAERQRFRKVLALWVEGMRLKGRDNRAALAQFASISETDWCRLQRDHMEPRMQGRIAGESGVTASGCPYHPGALRRRWLRGHQFGRKVRAARNPLDYAYSVDARTV